MKNDILEVLYTNDEIILKAQELGKRITKDYENQRNGWSRIQRGE